MLVLDGTIVNVALPSIQRSLNIAPSHLSWVLNAYALTFGGLLLVCGRAGDLFGRKRMFRAGLAVFTLASLLGGIATSETVLIVARALQGAGAAITAPVALSLLATTFPAGPARTKATGAYGAVAGGRPAAATRTSTLDGASIALAALTIGAEPAMHGPVWYGTQATAATSRHRPSRRPLVLERSPDDSHADRG